MERLGTMNRNDELSSQDDSESDSVVLYKRVISKKSSWDQYYLKLRNVKIALAHAFSQFGMMDIWNWIKMLLVPERYPHSVTKNYLVHQIFYLTHIFFGTIAGILATQEVFHTFGYSIGTTYPLAATLMWIYKDGFAQFGKILFCAYQRYMLNSYSRRIYICSQLLIDVASCIEMCMSMFGSWAVLFLAITTVLRTLDGVSKASRLSLNSRFALRGNTADVNAKEISQETVVKFFASMLTVLFLGCFGLLERQLIFAVALCLHMACRYMSLRSVSPLAPNEPRCREPTTALVSRREPIFSHRRPFVAEHMITFMIRVVPSLRMVIRDSTKADDLRLMNRVYRDQMYILYPDLASRVINIVMKPEDYTSCIVGAYMHALLLAMFICAINRIQLPIFKEVAPNFRTLVRMLSLSRWPRVPARYRTDRGLEFEPSEALLFFTLRVTRTEWCNMFQEFFDAGFIIHRHLFAAEEWRAGVNLAPTNQRSPDHYKYPSTTEFDAFEDAITEATALRRAELTTVRAEQCTVHIAKPDIEPQRPQHAYVTVLRRSFPDETITRLDTPTPERKPEQKKG